MKNLKFKNTYTIQKCFLSKIQSVTKIFKKCKLLAIIFLIQMYLLFHYRILRNLKEKNYKTKKKSSV